MQRLPSLLLAVAMCAGLGACASPSPDLATLTGGHNQADRDKTDAVAKAAPTDLEGGVRQAHLMRLAGNYDDAIRTLSQLMLVASDDPRVVSEYGKTLAEKGRAQEAVQFLNRATELAPGDWTLYSALGVSYDQLGNQNSARAAYEHALALKPGDPSILNNYALSRMLADDPDGAREMIGRAELAGGAANPKIARNIALVNKLAAPAEAPGGQSGVAAQASGAKPAGPAHPNDAPSPLAQRQPAPQHIAQAPRAPQPIPLQAPAQQPAPSNRAPRALTGPVAQNIAPDPNRVVMQAVPFDPLAGPVKPAAKIAPKPVRATVKPAPAKPVQAKADQAKVDATETAPEKPAPAKTPAKTDNIKAAKTKPLKDTVPALRMTADARSP